MGTGSEHSGGRSALTDLTVMVTRPAHQAGHLVHLLEAAGARPFLFPVMEVLEPADSQPLLAIIDRLETFDLAVFVSPNAVNKAMNLIKARRELPPDLQYATVGKRSAVELRNYLGRDPEFYPRQKFDSEALLALPGMQDMTGKRVVIFRGDGGREYLGDTLQARGARVEYAEAYRRGRPHADVGALQRQWARGGIDVVTVTSGAGLRNLFDMVGKLAQHWLRRTQLVVIHERLVPIAHELGFKCEPLVAHEASDEALVEAIRAWRHRADSEKGEDV